MENLAHHMQSHYVAEPVMHHAQPYFVEHNLYTAAIDHDYPEGLITPMTEMIDSAVDNMIWGQ